MACARGVAGIRVLVVKKRTESRLIHTRSISRIAERPCLAGGIDFRVSVAA